MKKAEISDEEIHSYMDFDRVLTQHQTLKTVARNHFLRKLLLGSSILVVGVITLLWFFENSRMNLVDSKSQFEKSIIEGPADTLQERRPVVTNDKTETEPVTPDEERSKKKSKTMSDPQIGKADESKKELAPNVGETSETPATQQPVYAQAEPVDGYPKLYEYFSTELKYPEVMMKDSIQGVVMVMFTINVKGEPEKITIDQSLGKAFDDEAVRLIAKMPRWKPATYNTKPVPSRISLPITFQIQKLKLEQ